MEQIQAPDEIVPFLTTENGYCGWFSRNQAEGAIPNGSFIRKSLSGGPSPIAVGDIGQVLGSIKLKNGHTCYFVEWQRLPKCAVAIFGHRIELAGANELL